MRHDTVPYDEATWAVDEALVRAANADAAGAIRLVSGSLVMDVVDDVECSVLLAERARKRTLRERLFGIGKEKK